MTTTELAVVRDLVARARIEKQLAAARAGRDSFRIPTYGVSRCVYCGAESETIGCPKHADLVEVDPKYQRAA